MKKILVLLVGILTLMFTTAEAQKKGKSKLSKECKKELRTYYQANVYPVKKAAHDQMMTALSAEDVAFVNEKRADMQAIKAEFRVAKKEAKDMRKNGATKDEIKSNMQATKESLKKKKIALKESMQPFMERNKATIEEAMTPFKETRKKWRAEKKVIIDKYLTEEQKAKRDARQKEIEAKKAENKNKSTKTRKAHSRIGFILWDSSKKENNEDVDDIELEEELFIGD